MRFHHLSHMLSQYNMHARLCTGMHVLVSGETRGLHFCLSLCLPHFCDA